MDVPRGFDFGFWGTSGLLGSDWSRWVWRIRSDRGRERLGETWALDRSSENHWIDPRGDYPDAPNSPGFDPCMRVQERLGRLPNPDTTNGTAEKRPGVVDWGSFWGGSPSWQSQTGSGKEGPMQHGGCFFFVDRSWTTQGRQAATNLRSKSPFCEGQDPSCEAPMMSNEPL